MKNRRSIQDHAFSAPADDNLVAAARALLSAIEAEPVPPHLTALAQALQVALQARADGDSCDG